MILEPSAADAVKRAIDAAHPVWRQVGIPVHREIAPWRAYHRDLPASP